MTVKKDIEYTMMGFCLNDDLKNYLILHVEEVAKSILDFEGSNFEEILERFIEDAEDSSHIIDYDYETEKYIFKTMFRDSQFVQINNYEDTQEFFIYKFKDRDSFFEALNNKEEFLQHLESVDVHKEFDYIENKPFKMHRMVHFKKEIPLNTNKALIEGGTIKKVDK